MAIEYGGGTGESIEDSVIILGAKSTKEGIQAEVDHISSILGNEGFDWDLESQELLQNSGHSYDKMVVQELGELPRTFYFDITDFFGGQ